jgi:hypothetical protein
MEGGTNFFRQEEGNEGFRRGKNRRRKGKKVNVERDNAGKIRVTENRNERQVQPPGL